MLPERVSYWAHGCCPEPCAAGRPVLHAVAIRQSDLRVVSMHSDRNPGGSVLVGGDTHDASGLSRLVALLVVLGTAVLLAIPCVAALHTSHPLAATPPMGWNDWAHYECSYNAETILANARALVKSGLATHGYNTVTIDDCWMQKARDGEGNLQVDPQRFPNGMKAVADAVRGMGLKFGIYEDAGFATCGRFAGSGEPDGGGQDHFAQDARLFASWGVSYLKLDGCNVYARGASDERPDETAYRKAYAKQSAVLKSLAVQGHPIVFSESAPAYFQGMPSWNSVLGWVKGFGQLWREGDDIDVFNPKKPDDSRFPSILWNYAYNLPLGRFQTPGNWNDADFIIGGDRGITLNETRSQVALWSMMSAPLILSQDLTQTSAVSLAVLSNAGVLAVDQDALGREATLLRRSDQMDVLWKPLQGGDFALAVFNRGPGAAVAAITPAELGFAGLGCRLNTHELWSGKAQSFVTSLHAPVASHDTEIWRVHPAAGCGAPVRTGTITMISDGKQHDIASYTHCLAAGIDGQAATRTCAGGLAEAWTFSSDGTLQAGGQCLAAGTKGPMLERCTHSPAQRWSYTLAGNVKSSSGECLTSSGWTPETSQLSVQTCGGNLPGQIWSLPNALPGR
jgi:alpha-galactosidase